MPSKVQAPGPSQTYQRFAWVTLALAALVALSSTDRAEPAAAAPVASIAEAPSAPKPARLAQSAFTSPGFAGAEDGESADAGAPADEEPGESEGTGSTQAADPALDETGQKGPGASPATAAQAGQLIATSRNRSGGVDQGDEPIRRAAM